MSSGPRRTAVYRFYDAADTLLYVGMTVDTRKRWAHHASNKPWWPDVARREVVWYARSGDAAREESRAMEEERPLHNVSGSPWRPTPKADGSGLEATLKPPPRNDRHLNKHVIGIRVPDKSIPDAVRTRAKAAGHGDLSELTIRFLRWYLREEGVTLPQRPPKPDAGE
jgi:hypothetical protein